MKIRIIKALLAGLFCFLTLLPAAAWAQGAPATVSGTVVDPDNELIPGATVTFSLPGGKPAATIQSGSDGTYTVKVPSGTYAFTITMPGFSPFVRPGVRVNAGQALTINAKMTLEDEKQEVMVTASENTVSVDADSNASSTVIKGDALDALSDDPDELSSELSALAGPAVGPNGGQIYIDGFTGGQLPPKSSIREIRINQNPFSAQYDRVGYGRVEVFTKPGTDKFHGNAQLNGYDSSFNTGSPLLGTAPIQPYHTIFFFGNLTGPINKNASFTIGGSRRDIQDNTIINPPGLYSFPASPGIPCLPTDVGCSITTSFTQALLTPQTRWDISPRLDLALGEKNTLTTRIQYTSNVQSNQGSGGVDLASVGYTTSSSEFTLQMSDTQIVSPKVINETRFEFQRTPSSQTPLSTAPSLNVQGAFEGGGATTGSSNVVDQHIEAQNYTSIALKKNFVRFGGRLRTTGETNTSTSGQNGQFTYNSIADYQSNTPNQYTVTHITTPTIRLRTLDVGLYAEDDWKIKPNLTLSYGLRFETQNYISDKKDFAPRISVAYGVAKKTVLRGGFGIFYDRFMLTNQANVVRSPTITPFVVQGTSLTSACTPANPAGCNLGVGGQTTTYALAPKVHAPYTMQTAVGIDQQLFKGATVSVNYLNARGVHQFNSSNATYVQNGQATTGPIQYQYQSAGVFRQNQIIMNLNYRATRTINIYGFYSLNFARSDTGGISTFATVPGNLKADYGRATFDTRNRLFLGGSVGLKYNISVSPFMVANSGTPYNLTTGADNNLDTVINDRPAFATAGTTGAKTIPGCGTFAATTNPDNSNEIPVNYCTGPANFTMNLRLTKTFGFGPRTGPPPSRSGGQRGGGPGGVQQGGPPGGGGGGRGPGGPGGRGPGGGGTNTGRRYNLTFGAQGTNIFNIVDRNVPVGVLTSPKFGQSTQLAGNIFTSNSAVRRVLLQASFNF